MKISIGSRVKFLNDVGGGKVLSFKDDGSVLVKTIDGFEVPVMINELVIDESDSYDIHADKQTKKPSGSANVVAKKKVQEVSFEEKKFVPQKGEVILALVPDNDNTLHVSSFSLYLVNDSNYYFQFIISSTDIGMATLIKSGTIAIDTKLLIKKYSQTEVSRLKGLRLQGHFLKHGNFEPKPAIDLSFDLSEISFYKIGFFSDNDYFDEKALVLKKEEIDQTAIFKKLSQSDIAKVIKTKEPEAKPIVSKVQKEQFVEEVDLHIEQIIDNHKSLSNGEIVEIQLGRFETSLETAIRANTKKIVFIHGIGNGKLKLELRNKLDRKYPDLKYQDASFKEYGFGATMVYLK